MHAALETLERRVCLTSVGHWHYVLGQDFAGSGSRETVELIGIQRRVYVGCTFTLGSTDVRLNHCRLISFIGCRFSGMTGPADPDGSGLQTIDSGDVLVDRCTFIASPFASDLISVYGDEPYSGAVTVQRSRLYGAGDAGFSTSICVDGPAGGTLVAIDDLIRNARCGLTVASGRAVVAHDTFAGCQTEIYVFSGYGRAATLLTDRPRDVLLGAGGSVGQV